VALIKTEKNSFVGFHVKDITTDKKIASYLLSIRYESPLLAVGYPQVFS